jgi:hypothetical protein
VFQSLGAPLPQHLNCRIPVNQFTALGLRKTRFDVSRHSLAPLDHPIFKIELFGMISDA